jgi:hypothetical protein
MSKYEELCRLGRLYAVDSAQVERDCKLFANSLMLKLADYLACSPAAMVYRELDKKLGWGDKKLAVADAVPELKRIEDGFWYFAVDFDLAGNAVVDRFAVKKAGEIFVVRHDLNKYEIGPGSEDDFNVFFDYWYKYITNELSGLAGETSAKIGFCAGN